MVLRQQNAMNNDFLSSASENGLTWTPALETLLQGIRDATDLDFSGYSRPSLARRIRARMQRGGYQDLRAYADYCRIAPQEYNGLAQTILIPATSFFRDPLVWEGLGALLVSRLPARRPLRLWCAGCASGEEAYTVAMVMAEALGVDQPAACIHLDATDIADSALTQARRGHYAPARVAGVPPRLRDRYFARAGDNWAIRPALRDAVHFQRHDLTQDPLLDGIDFISCRNTLMYFEPALQTRILTGMAQALVPGGGLLLGRAEGILPGIQGFTLWDRSRRLFQTAKSRSAPDYDAEK
jgi:two-component system CheB/CheR fusion protein